MALFFPILSHIVGKMQPGERRFARRLESALEDDYLCWYEASVGAKNQRPDFTLLHPGRGILVLEVKDWKLDTIRAGDRNTFTILGNAGLKTVANPLEQVRQYAHHIVNLLEKDPQLQQQQGKHRGKLCFPYGYGVVFTNLTRPQLRTLGMDEVIDPRLMLCKEDLSATIDAEAFQQKLWDMFNYQFSHKLTQPQIDRVRWHLWPEVRVVPAQETLFDEPATDGDSPAPLNIPDIIRVMDYQQEQLARSLGEGHRVIHGVAGSGKTMILGYRCLYLAKLLHKPILVLCFNVTLAAKLRSYTRFHQIEDKVSVYHFHEWCSEQLRTYQIKLPPGPEAFFDRQVTSVIRGVETGHIPRAQYGAVLIDEAHDFQPEWLKLVTGMVDPETDSLLLLYDDAQSIYKNHKLGFTLSSVGVQARGRTTILKLNYRNTRQILQLAYRFAQHAMKSQDTDEDGLPIIQPEAAGIEGLPPVLRSFSDKQQESEFIVRCLQKWHDAGKPWRDIGVVYRSKSTGMRLAKALEGAGIPYLLTHDKASKASYSIEADRINLLTMHSSKGLEFSTVIVAGVGEKAFDKEEQENEVRLLYIAMTRAMEQLLITTCGKNAITEQLAEVIVDVA